MPLRRVTLSGRLARYVSETPEPVIPVIIKGLLATGVDVAVALGVAIFAYKVFMGNLAETPERGFYCYEIDGINHEYHPNTVSSKHLLAVTLAFPFFVIFYVEAVLFYYSKGVNRLRKYFFSTTSTYLEYLGTFLIGVLFMEGAKCMFARLRPHYLSVCKPNWDLINCTNRDSFIETAYCTGTDAHRIRIGRQSFPSGHSGAAIFFLVFTYIYLTGLSRASNLGVIRRLRAVLLTVITLWTTLVLATRVTDHWHHPTDVLAGVLIGALCAVPFYLRDTDSYLRRREIEHPHSE